MEEEKDTTIQSAPVVKQEEKEEFEEKVIVDPIEKTYGTDPAKATKTVKVKKEPKVDVKPQVKQEEKKLPDAKLPSTEKTEPLAEKPQEKKIEVSVKAEDWSDPLSSVTVKDAPTQEKLKQEEKAPLKTPQQLQEEIIAPEIKKDAEAWKKFTSTTVGKFVVEIMDSGGDPIQALQEAQPKDYSAMKAENLMQDYFAKIEGLQGEELQAAIDEHFDESVTTGNQRRKAEREARTALDYRQQNVLNKLKTDTINNKNKGQEVIPQFHSAVEKEVEDSYVKKAAYGIKLTPDQAQELTEQAKSIFSRLIKPDGTVNEKLAVFYLFSELHRGTLRKNDYLNGDTKGKEVVLEAVHQPDRMESSISSPKSAERETTEQIIDRKYGLPKPN